MRCLPVLLLATAWLTALAGCSRSVTAEPIAGTEGADALWAGGSSFCARTPKGLLCWDSGEDSPTESVPTIVPDLGRVEAVALEIGEACALDDQGVTCFHPAGGGGSRRIELDKPRSLVSAGSLNHLFCALDAAGVACWSRNAKTATRQAFLGKPDRLHVTVDGAGLCTETGDTLQCYAVKAAGLSPTFGTHGVRSLRALYAGEIGGELVALDEQGLRHAKVSTVVSSGNPFAYTDPLAVPIQIAPVRGASVTLAPVEGLADVRAFTAYSIWKYVLVADGVKALDLRAGRAELKPWPMEGVPDTLWGSRDAFFFARRGQRLSLHGWQKGARIDREVKGVTHPRHVVTGLYYSCVLHDAGVACLPMQRT